MRVRPYRSDDVDALLAIFVSAVRDVAARDYTPEQIAAWAPDPCDREGWALRFQNDVTWVAEVDGRVVGFLTCKPDGLIDLLYVHATHQRRGVATALLDAAERQARTRLLSRMYTEASVTAQPFFARNGFDLIAQQAVTRRGQEIRNFRMERCWTDGEPGLPGQARQ